MKLTEKKLNIKSIIIITVILPVIVIAVSSVAIYITARSVQPQSTIDMSFLEENEDITPVTSAQAFDFITEKINSAVDSGLLKYTGTTTAATESIICDNKNVEEILSFAGGSLSSKMSSDYESTSIKYGEDASRLLSLLPDGNPDSFEAASENGILTVDIIYTTAFGNMYFIENDTKAVKLFSKENERVFSTINEKFIPQKVTYTVRYDESIESLISFEINRQYEYSSHISFVNTLSDVGSTPLSMTLSFCESYTLSTAGIFIENDVMTLEKNGYDTLTVIPFTEENLSEDEFSLQFTSSDDSVATVDENGQVTAVRTSDEPVVITVELNYLGKTFTDSCLIYVCEPVTSITLDKTELSLKIGEASTLTATIKPDDATVEKLGFITSDSDIVTVNENGEITAVGTGTATVSVYSVQSFVAAQCTVTVTD